MLEEYERVKHSDGDMALYRVFTPEIKVQIWIHQNYISRATIYHFIVLGLSLD